MMNVMLHKMRAACTVGVNKKQMRRNFPLTFISDVRVKIKQNHQANNFSSLPFLTGQTERVSEKDRTEK